MGQELNNVIRRAASVAVVAGSVAVGVAFAGTSAGADPVQHNGSGVLVNVTPDGTYEAPGSSNGGCRTTTNPANQGCKVA